jgi:NAD(P)-dependent dehydrogenase (short-subunit alcohol dehydrogenase family)
LLFAQEGARVVIAARRKPVIEETAEMIRGQGGQVVIAPGDATKREDVDHMIEMAMNQFGRLDVLYNSVGGGWVEMDKRLHELTTEAFDQIIASSLTAAFNTCRAALKVFLDQAEGGSIILVAASRVVRRMANPIYAYAKAGLVEMTRNMANDYHQDGIRVNCLLPGLFVYEPVKEPTVRPVSDPLIRRQPRTARQGDPADLAYAALYLASDESSFVTGACITVDGGNDVKLVDLVLD